MRAPHEHKKVFILVTALRWFLGVVLLIAALSTLSHLHILISHVEHSAVTTYDLDCCNPVKVLVLGLLQLIIAFLLLVSKTARWGAFLGMCFFIYVIAKLYFQEVPFWPKICVNIIFLCGLYLISLLHSFIRYNETEI